MRIMLANYDEEYNKELYERFIKFKNVEEIHCFTNGQDVIEKLAHINYDIIIFNLFLPEKDGIDILNSIKLLKFSRRSIFIGLCNTTNKTIVNKYLELDIDYLFFKPFNSNAIENRLKLLIENYEYITDNCKLDLEVTQKNYIQDNLAQYNFKKSTLGYKYLVEAILLCVENNELTKNITKGLYIEVAKKCDTNFYNVERAIRHLIKSQYERNSAPFNEIVNGNKKHLTNGNFISHVVQNISKVDLF